MTVSDFRNKAIKALSSITDNAEFEAEQLMQYALNLSKNELVVGRKSVLTPEKSSKLEDVLSRRMSREPLQYICGEWEFFGLRMFCGDGCLIPRPETEMIAEYAINSLPKGGHLLDLCTGSGCIAVSVLNNRHDITATAVDISPKALAYAKKNAEYHGVSDRLELVECDVMDYMPLKIPDVISSNPPYIKSDDIFALSPEVRHEPEIALNGGYDGLDFYKIIASRFGKYLGFDGKIILEVGYDIASEAAAVFKGRRFDTEIVTDIYGVERMCIAKLRR